MLQRLNKLLPDPPPPLVFEIGKGAMTGVRRVGATITARARRALPDGVIDISSSTLKIVDSDALRNLLNEMLVELAPAPRPAAAVFLPDSVSRLTVLDFDTLPSKSEDIRSLIAFRLKKTIPFDVGEARISYKIQKSRSMPSVLVAAAHRESVRPLEQLFGGFGLHLGFVAPSSASMLNLVSAKEMTLVAKLGDGAITMAAVDKSAVRLVRRVEAPAGFNEAAASTLPELVADLYPTFVYIEDHLGAPVAKLLLAGFGEGLHPAIDCFSHELGCRVEALQSANGVVGAEDAGIQGYLHAA